MPTADALALESQTALLSHLLSALPESTVRSLVAATLPADPRDTASLEAVANADPAQGGQIATMAERLAAVRQSFAHEAISHGPPSEGAGRR